MKKMIFSLLAVCAFVSCSRDTFEPSSTMEDLRISASFSDPVRTSYHGTGELTWSYGDRINIFDGTASNEFTTYVTECPSTADFYGQVTKGWSKLVGVYPFNEKNQLLSGGKVKIVVPPYQIASAGGFTDGANPSVGETTSSSGLTLKNVGAYIKLSFTSSREVRAIYIASNAKGTNLAGIMTFNASTAAFVEGASGNNSVSLIPEGKSIAPDTYYAVVAPVKLVGGLRVFFRLADGTVLCKQGNNTVSLVRNETLDLGAINVDELHTATEPSLNPSAIMVGFGESSQPFTEALPTNLVTGEKKYTTPAGYEFIFLVNPVEDGGNSRGQGWKLAKTYLALYANNYWEKGNVEYLDGITLPVIPGKRLVSVEVSTTSNTFPVSITDANCREVFYDDDYATMPPEKYNSNGNWLPGTHVFSLPSSKVEEAYRIVARKGSSFCYISSLYLIYETIVPVLITPLVDPTEDIGFDQVGFDVIVDDGELI